MEQLKLETDNASNNLKNNPGKESFQKYLSVKKIYDELIKNNELPEEFTKDEKIPNVR